MAQCSPGQLGPAAASAASVAASAQKTESLGSEVHHVRGRNVKAFGLI